MLGALREHWPEYLMEAAGLGFFMISASAMTIVLEYPASPIRQAIPDAIIRRLLMGLAMGLTAIAIIYSPWGKQSGAHINPAVTLTFWRLGKIPAWDAVFYVLAQFAGGLAGVGLVAVALHGALADPSVNYVVTVPGRAGVAVAFMAEAAMSLVLMLVILVISNTRYLAWARRARRCLRGVHGQHRRRGVRRHQLGRAAAAVGERSPSSRARQPFGCRRSPLHAAQQLRPHGHLQGQTRRFFRRPSA